MCTTQCAGQAKSKRTHAHRQAHIFCVPWSFQYHRLDCFFLHSFKLLLPFPPPPHFTFYKEPFFLPWLAKTLLCIFADGTKLMKKIKNHFYYYKCGSVPFLNVCTYCFFFLLAYFDAHAQSNAKLSLCEIDGFICFN